MAETATISDDTMGTSSTTATLADQILPFLYWKAKENWVHLTCREPMRMFQQRHLLRIDVVLAATQVAKVSSGNKSDFPNVLKLVEEVGHLNIVVLIESIQFTQLFQLFFFFVQVFNKH